MSKTYIHTVQFECNFAGDYGTIEVESDEETLDPVDLFDMALDHFGIDAVVTDTDEIEEED